MAEEEEGLEVDLEVDLEGEEEEEGVDLEEGEEEVDTVGEEEEDSEVINASLYTSYYEYVKFYIMVCPCLALSSSSK